MKWLLPEMCRAMLCLKDGLSEEGTPEQILAVPKTGDKDFLQGFLTDELYTVYAFVHVIVLT